MFLKYLLQLSKATSIKTRLKFNFTLYDSLSTRKKKQPNLCDKILAQLFLCFSFTLKQPPKNVLQLSEQEEIPIFTNL